MSALDKQISDKSILKHPFYQAWTAGELSMESLQDYAKQYYHHVAAFPTYLSAVHAHTEDPQVRRHLLQNLIDEEAGSPNHPGLWLQFCEGLGVTGEQAESVERYEATDNLINSFRSVCRDGSSVEGIAALYAYESQIPAVSESKISGLEEHYGMKNPSTTAYFHVHIEADKEHSLVERELLSQLVTEDNFEAVSASADVVLDSLWGMLSGICEHNNISMS